MFFCASPPINPRTYSAVKEGILQLKNIRCGQQVKRRLSRNALSMGGTVGRWEGRGERGSCQRLTSARAKEALERFQADLT